MTDPQQQEFGIHTIYLKDVSFEAPNSPAIFQSQFQTNIEMNLNVETNKLAENIYEVVLSVTVTAKAIADENAEPKPDDKTAFLVELQQAGVFSLSGFDEDSLGPMLGIYCPNVLFPYARETTASLVAKGGFPQLILEPVNFEAMYAQHVNSQNPED